MQTEHQTVKLKRKRKRKNKSILGYIYLFVFVFATSLVCLSFFVKTYTPKVEISIGNPESMTLSEPDIGVEIKPVDERLKWIQMEDEMPSVAIREAKESTEKIIEERETKKDKEQEETKTELEKRIVELPSEAEPIYKKETDIPKPEISNIISTTLPQAYNFRQSDAKPVIPAPIPTLTKVYLGNFLTIDEAMKMQEKVANDIPEATPFIKSQNGTYIVQLGSFSNKTMADSFILKLKEKGYNPRILNQN